MAEIRRETSRNDAAQELLQHVNQKNEIMAKEIKEMKTSITNLRSDLSAIPGMMNQIENALRRQNIFE